MKYRLFAYARTGNVRVSIRQALSASTSGVRRTPPILRQVIRRDMEQRHNGNLIPIACLSDNRYCFGRVAINSVLQRKGPITKAGRIINDRLCADCRSFSNVLGSRRRGNYANSRSNRGDSKTLIGRNASCRGRARASNGRLRRLVRSFR